MSVLADLKARLLLDNKQFNRELKESKGKVDKFSQDVNSGTKGMASGFAKVGTAIAVAFAVKEVAQFAFEMAETGKQVNNVHKAFQVLNIDIASLRASTAGMVSDFQLEKMAVQAKNLGLPMKDLATYFKFASIRAAETGESVDYLVNSIVTGIGRKSVLIMDNLGISSVALNEEIKKTGDFATAAGNIIKSQMGDATLSIEDVTTGLGAMKTEWSNLTNEIARSQELEEPINDLGKAIAYLIRKAAELKDVAWNMMLLTNPELAAGLKSTTALVGFLADEYERISRTFETPKWIKDMQEDIKGSSQNTMPPLLEGQKQAEVSWRNSINSIKQHIKELNKELNEATDQSVRDRILKEIEYAREVEKIYKGISDVKKENVVVDSYDKQGTSALYQAIDGYKEMQRTMDLTAEQAAQLEIIIKSLYEQIDAIEHPSEALEKLESNFAKFLGEDGNMGMGIQSITKDVLDLGDALEHVAARGITMFAQAMGEMMGGGDSINALEVFINGIASLMQEFGGLLIAWGVGQIALKASIANPYAAIAAGAALVVIGSALAASQNRVTGSSGTGYNSYSGGGYYYPNGYGNNGYSGGDGFKDGKIEFVQKGEDLIAVVDIARLKQAYTG